MANVMSSTGIVHSCEGGIPRCNWSNFRGNTGALPESWHSTTMPVSCKNCLRLMGDSKGFSIDQNLHTLFGRVPGVHMETRFDGGGIHMWISGQVEYRKANSTVSVHLSAKEAFLLATEIMYRISKGNMK